MYITYCKRTAEPPNLPLLDPEPLSLIRFRLQDMNTDNVLQKKSLKSLLLVIVNIFFGNIRFFFNYMNEKNTVLKTGAGVIFF